MILFCRNNLPSVVTTEYNNHANAWLILRTIVTLHSENNNCNHKNNEKEIDYYFLRML